MIRLGFFRREGDDVGRAPPVAALAERALARSGLLGKDLLVSLSGGCDSVCLLHILAEFSFRHGGVVHAAHVDHGLRPDSGDDAEFCLRLAAELGIAFHLFRLSAGQFRRGESVQAEARRLRRSLLQECLKREGLTAIALGHHRDDQVETILYRLLRGTATRGAAGMALWDPPYVRPLLQVPKEELRRVAREGGWIYKEDPTNRSERFLRNRMRHRVVPVLRTVAPGGEDALLRFAERMAEDDAALSALAGAALSRLGTREPEGIRLPAAQLAELAVAVRKRVYLAAWTELGFEPQRLEARHLEAVDTLLGPGRAHRRAPVPGPGAFMRSYGELWILGPAALRPQTIAERFEEPGSRCLGGEARLVWSASAPPTGAAVGVPEGRPAGELTVRTWKAGDRVPGPGQGRKIKDLLMEARLPAWRRRRALVIGDELGTFGVLAPEFAWSAGQGAAGTVSVEGRWFSGPPSTPGRTR